MALLLDWEGYYLCNPDAHSIKEGMISVKKLSGQDESVFINDLPMS